MVPTDAALRMIEPSASILRAAEVLFAERARLRAGQQRRTPSRRRQRLPGPACSCRSWSRRSSARRRGARSRSIRCRPSSTTGASSAAGDVDVVIGNWLKPPEDLHLGRLFGDEVVCLVAADHPAAARAAGRGTSALPGREHIAPTPTAPRRARRDRRAPARRRACERNITARCAHFGLIPLMVRSSWLVLTTGRQFCTAICRHALGRAHRRAARSPFRR